ncbi:MAG: DUF1152 domain-containing protein [Candidatus Methanomethylicaceae archaeon]|nr:DUF1152 domain-containing protein [Candidatus Verstraetearchaeota archaeon]
MNSILFIALGGGGDVISAAMLALAFRRIGIKTNIASIVWERFSIDPIPGPIRFNEIKNAEKIGEYSMIVFENTKAIRGGKEILFQAVNVSKAIKEEIGIVDINSGVEGLEKGIKELAKFLKCNKIIGVDVGGDILSTGFEKNLWSPLADFLGLAALSKQNGIIAVHSLGSDGELNLNYLLKRIAFITKKGGFLGIRGMNKYDIEILERILNYAESEASRVSLMAWKGFYGYLKLRNNSRKTFVTPLNTLTFFLKSKIVAKYNPVIKELMNTKSLEEARKVLNEKNIFTELDLEEGLFKMINDGKRITSELIKEIRNSFFNKY